jgi:hypothetical protein
MMNQIENFKPLCFSFPSSLVGLLALLLLATGQFVLSTEQHHALMKVYNDMSEKLLNAVGGRTWREPLFWLTFFSSDCTSAECPRFAATDPCPIPPVNAQHLICARNVGVVSLCVNNGS